jgi:proline iminopeptidase
MRACIRDTEIYFDVDGASLVPEGTGMHERPTAFLISGGPGSDHAAFKWRWGSLADKLQVVYFDHRGHGRSARGDPDKYTLDENVADMEALRRHLGLESIVSIGASYGGMVAMAHAARFPDAVSHLILVATCAHSGYAQRAMELVRQRGNAEQIALCDDMFCGRLDTVQKMQHYYEVMGPLYSRNFDAAKARQGNQCTILSPDAFNKAHGPGGFLRSFDLRPQLPAISAPTLIIAGRHDWICAPEFSAELHALIPDSELRVFEGSGHTVGGDEPQRLLDAIAGFVVYRTRSSR